MIINEIRRIESEQQYEEFKNKIGQVISGVVEKIERDDIVVRVGTAELYVSKRELLPRDHFNQGDRIRMYLSEIEQGHNRTHLLLSRTHPGFVEKLFAQEIPEIYDGIIAVKGIAVKLVLDLRLLCILRMVNRPYRLMCWCQRSTSTGDYI